MRLFWIVVLLVMGSSGTVLACEGRLVDEQAILGGAVCVPAEPERIVVLDPTYSLGMTLELGLPVVGAPLFSMSDKALKSQAVAAGVEDLGSFAEPSLETIVALQPDLIIGSALAGEGTLALASRIAPTVLIGEEDWKDYYRLVGRATGREGDVEAALHSYEERVRSVRARVPDARVSVLRITPWDFQVYLDSPAAYGPFEVLRDAGVKRSAYETSDQLVSVKRPDWEELAALDGGILLYIVGGANDSAASGRHEEVIGNPLWAMLPAVQAGRVARVDAATWMEFSGLASANRVLDDIERYIIEQ